MSGGGAGEKTEKATPKKQEEAREKGQVARSADVGGSVVLIAGLAAILITGPALVQHLQDAMRATFALVATPEAVSRQGLGRIVGDMATTIGLSLTPIVAACLLAGVAASVAQVGFKPSVKAAKPDVKRLNPLQGAKNIFGPHGAFEAVKTVVKLGAVGAIVAMVVWPKLEEFGALVGMPAEALGPALVSVVKDVAIRGAAAYLVIAAVDYAYQRYRHDKQLRMDKHEVKEETKQQSTPQEVKNAQRRAQMEAARGRMMDAIPTADVVVTNPTHYAVALRYDPEKPAPEVVAKGKDQIAFRIRELAAEHGVQIVPDPPLARALHAGVEIGGLVPEGLFQSVAEVLAFVYRQAARRRAAGEHTPAAATRPTAGALAR